MENTDFDAAQKDDWLMKLIHKYPVGAWCFLVGMAAVMFLVIWSINR